MNRHDWIEYGIKELSKEEIENAQGEAWYLFSHCFHITREDYLFSMTEEVVEGKELQLYKEYIKERITKRMPLQYILGTQDFMGYTFRVTPDVLIPRADTESVLETVIESGIKPKSILDVCTGSGCIAVSLGLILRPERCMAVDIDADALKIAKENGRNLLPMVEFIQSDLFESVFETFDLIISNPPYIPTKDCEELMPEVREHEPLIALDGMEDGLHFYRRIVKEAPGYLNDNGMLAFEIGYNQGKDVKCMMEEAGFIDVILNQDLAGLDRVVMGRKKG
ncbi:MAG: peptide chain release factor N(5)-glutamine methyltransferase [Anaerostipes sp.]|nr:peptide chain release factor N(5)-glutamine methyltransferase [Anaerostipes sp.]